MMSGDTPIKDFPSNFHPKQRWLLFSLNNYSGNSNFKWNMIKVIKENWIGQKIF